MITLNDLRIEDRFVWYDEFMKYSKNQGSVLAVIVVIFSIVIVGVLSYALWSNFFAPKNNMTQQTNDKSTDGKTVTIPDMLTYDPAVEVTGLSDSVQLVDAPESFKSFIVNSINNDNNEIKAQDSDCYRVISVNSIYLQKYASGGFNTGGGDCVGGAAILWALVDGSWTLVSTTQNIGFDCEKLEEYNIPSKIGGSTCFTTNPAYPEGKPYSRN